MINIQYQGDTNKAVKAIITMKNIVKITSRTNQTILIFMYIISVFFYKRVIFKFCFYFCMEFSLKSNSEFTFPYQLQKKLMCLNLTPISGSGGDQTSIKFIYERGSQY